MATKQIRVALWEYTNAEGKRRKAFFGDIVDLPDDEVERGEKAGVFGPATGSDAALAAIVGADRVDEVPPPADEDLDHGPADDEPITHTVSTQPTGEPVADVSTTLERPKQAAPKDAWVEYAKRRGMSEADAEAATKVELIEKFGG
jgi:hypothetical protein